MADYKVSSNDLASVADAIRTKGGTSAALSFPDGFVTAIGNISTGGNPTLITKNITANGTYNARDDNADGYSSVTVDVPSKLVTGTFIGTTSGAMDVNIPYTGSGYPIAGIIYPTVGTFKTGNAMASLAQFYAICMFAFCKNDISKTPDSTDAESIKSSVIAIYKSSDTDPTKTTANREYSISNYSSSSATASIGNCVRIKSPTQISVYIASTSYGFPANIEFTYQFIYSAA